MGRLLIVAILGPCTVPLNAWAQQPDTAKVKADAQKVASTIRGRFGETIGSRKGGFGRGSGGSSIGAASVCTVACCSSARAGEMSVTNTMATMIDNIFRPCPIKALREPIFEIEYKLSICRGGEFFFSQRRAI